MELKMMGGGGLVDFDRLTASPEDVTEDLIFLGAGSDEEQIGELPNMERIRSSPGLSNEKPDIPLHTADAVAITTDTYGIKRVALSPRRGKYPGNGQAYIGCTPSELGIVPEIISNGSTACGVEGNYGSDGNIVEEDMKEGKIGYGTNGRVIGSRKDYGTVNKTIGAGEIYEIKKGMYDGGRVTAKTLASQTEGNAVSEDIIKDKTATVNGKKVEGTMPELTDETTIQYAGNNATKVIPGDACFQQKNTDGVERLLIRYNGEKGRIKPNTLFGIPLNQLRAVIGYTDASKVLADTTIAGEPGSMVDRGNAQYGGFGEGDTYYAINKLPIGYYHPSYDWDTSWAPEARVSKDTLRAYLGITADKIAANQNIAGVIGKFTNDAVLDPQYLMEGQSGYDDGVLKKGTLPNRGTYGKQADGWAQYDGKLYFGFPRGAYYQSYEHGAGGAAECYIPNSSLGIDENQILRGHSIAGISGKAQKHGYAYGKVTSSSNLQIAADEGLSAKFAKITLNLPFTPVVGYLIYYISGNRDITVYAPNNGSSKYGAVMNFNQRKLNSLNSAAWAHGECGVECNGPNMVLPVAYTGVAYDYWFAGYY